MGDIMRMNSSYQMSQSDLMAVAPSVYAENAWSGVSSSYAFLSTAKVVEALAGEGILPYRANESRTRIEGKRGYTKHMVRFRPRQSETSLRTVGDSFPEVVVTNAHDKGSSFHVELGLYRLVCSNGLVVSAGMFQSYRIRHVGSTVEDVLKATYSILRQFPMVSSMVKTFQSNQLTESKRIEFAERALALRWEEGKAPFEPLRLLESRRMSDQGTDLWTTYNVIQENLTQGQRGNYRGYGRGRAQGSRAVRSIDVDLELNRGLWALAESFA